MNRSNYGIIVPRILLRCHMMLKVYFVQYFPVWEFIMIARFVPFSVLVAKAAARKPADYTRVIIG